LAFLTAGRHGAEVEGFGKGGTEWRRGCPEQAGAAEPCPDPSFAGLVPASCPRRSIGREQS